MALEIQGKLVKILPAVTGESKNGAWTKQEFVIETYDQYPKKICLSLWGDKVDSIRRYKEGDDVRASINIESREYNERWFTEVRAWKLDPAGAPGAAPQQGYAPQSAPSYGNQGQQQQSAPASVPNFQPADNPNFFKSDKEDDLPF